MLSHLHHVTTNGIPYLPEYKSTLYNLKIRPKNHPRLIHGSKTEITNCSRQFFCVTIAYVKENSKINVKIFKKILTQK